jgi:toxin ParE1/3/4
MRRRVSFHGMAERELHNAASYYNVKSSGLGHVVLDEVQRAVDQIREHPVLSPRSPATHV